MSSSGESASPGVSLSPGFLGSGLAPGLRMTVPAAAFGSVLAAWAAALAFSFSSLAFWAICALVSGFSGLAGLAWVLAAGILAAAAFATGLCACLAGFAACFSLAGAFLAGTDLEAAALAAGFLMGFAGFLDEALVTLGLP